MPYLKKKGGDPNQGKDRKAGAGLFREVGKFRLRANSLVRLDPHL
jgi:hypothetical protein